ncbi:SDR family NAD(P)-dependent oxidoreductase [Conexibacter sp. CPCC 206217]|uniref:SDR family NAD(P)-dependent oxidoreductase n=1 Tax=Conexibacter sp. CPCC 206217 TaxID=3064574 RepID=UPI002723C738|nr:SDR family NAD(P)-dependent oxidoreductase [Conexibacter sp. CPCC 206217]MDO8214033.1 SDR family NAD(P)-dependent oxidoreductase [Conexibacter sp. CPCC 206217]
MSDTFSTPADLSRLRDKVALVTGGASGIGRLTALALAEAGAEVVVADLDGTGAQQVAREVGGHAIATDVSDLDANLAAVAFAQERAGGLDLVFLNAGVTSDTGLGEQFDLALYRRAMGVNLDGVVFGAQAALPALKARGGGSIVATASLAGLLGVPMDAIYAANKHAVVGLTRSLGPLLAGDGIRFNAICPTFAETPLIAHAREALRGAGFELLDPQVVADTALRVFASDGTGECWFVQLGREPTPFAFRNVPGPRTEPPDAPPADPPIAPAPSAAIEEPRT